MFKSLSSAYKRGLDNYLHKSQGLVPIKKGDFFSLFWDAWITTFTPPLIVRSFEVAGVWPQDPGVVLDRYFYTPSLTNSEGSSSQGSISPSNWRSMGRLYRSAVKDVGSKEAKRLSNLLHSLQVQNLLLRGEIKGLKEVIGTQKVRNKPSRALDLHQGEEYHRGAVFFSPRRITAAIEFLHQKEQEEKEETAQKADRKEARALAKEVREKEVEERRQKRAEEKVARDQRKAEEAADKQARQ
ncbi:hypothetical protein EJ07DRAFT_158556 [Lizonia empirigonia]|nr:hypothetical protein EJ07DRAFT_158556 [Lizonia empirigonia]